MVEVSVFIYFKMIFTKQNISKAIEQLNFWFDKDLKVKIDAVRPIRSLSQNRYLHGVVFSVLAIELGLTIDEAKQLLKQNKVVMILHYSI